MKFEDVKALVQKKLKLPEFELDDASLATPAIHGELMNVLSSERMILRKYKYQLATLVLDKRDYYSGRLGPDDLKRLGWEQFDLKVLRADLDIYLDADPEVQELQLQIDFQNEKISYLTESLKMLQNRQWQIRNAIEWRKFTSGG